MKLHDVAALVQGEIAGDAPVEITGVAGVSDVQAGEITFLASQKHAQTLRESKAAAVLVTAVVADLAIPQIVVRNPQYAFARLLGHFYAPKHPTTGISEKAWIADTAEIGEGVTVSPFACVAEGARVGARSILYPGVYIGADTVVGEDCLLYPNVTIREACVLGNRVIIHAGAVIGADGFGYVHAEGQHRKIPQIGIVILEDDVEIGANTAIDRATTGKTVVGAGTKIDNLVQVGHNVVIGRQAIVVSQVGLGGSSRIGDGVMIGGQSGIADHAYIAAGTMLAAGSGVMPGALEKGVYAGAPVVPHRDWLRSLALTAQLPALKKKIQDLEQMVEKLREKKEEES
jgi:UDP-3-O-[3-hydroxymyristoyl] glucosamine N-acyltransferase